MYFYVFLKKIVKSHADKIIQTHLKQNLDFAFLISADTKIFNQLAMHVKNACNFRALQSSLLFFY